MEIQSSPDRSATLTADEDRARLFMLFIHLIALHGAPFLGQKHAPPPPPPYEFCDELVKKKGK